MFDHLLAVLLLFRIVVDASVDAMLVMVVIPLDELDGGLADTEGKRQNGK